MPSSLNSLKSEIDKLDIDKLETTPANLSKLSDLVKIDVVKKIVYDELVEKFNAIGTSGVVKKADYDDKIGEIEGKIPSITGLTTTAALTAIENKIPDEL